LGIEHHPNLEYKGQIFPSGGQVAKGFALGCSLCREQKFGMTGEEKKKADVEDEVRK
jgi:hypothetical protein